VPGIFLTPLLVGLFMQAGGGGSVASWGSIKSIVVQLLLPFLAGHFLRPLIGDYDLSHNNCGLEAILVARLQICLSRIGRFEHTCPGKMVALYAIPKMLTHPRSVLLKRRTGLAKAR
jgi:hypothetical protein